MVVEERERDTVERRLDGRDLREHIDAVALLLDHPLYPPHLPFDAAKALEDPFLVFAVTGCTHQR